MKIVLYVLSLAISVSSQITLEPKPLTGFEGQNVVVRCAHPMGTSNPEFELRVNGAPFNINHPKYRTIQVSGTVASYTYGPLERGELGASFTCDDTAGNTDEENINIFYPGSITETPGNVTATAGMNFVVYPFMTTLGNPDNGTFILFFNGSDSGVEDNKYNFNGTNLTLFNLMESDEGPYTLRYTNIAGSVEGQFLLNVDAATPSGGPSTTPALSPEQITGIAVGVSIVGIIIIAVIVIAIIVCICCLKKR